MTPRKSWKKNVTLRVMEQALVLTIPIS